LRVQGCDRKCEPCSLLELCGGIEQYGIHGYRCPYAGCKLKAPAIKRMQECRFCSMGKNTWDLAEEEVAKLVSDVKNLGAVKTRPPELPAVVPIISLKDPSSYSFGSLAIDALVVMFEDLFDEGIRNAVLGKGDIHDYLNFNGKVLVSSIMHDDLITQEAVFYYFLGLVDRLKFDAVIGWDSPVYVDIPLYDSWVNLLMGLKLTHDLVNWGMPVYGLAKGNTENQIKHSIETLARIGITSMALHASEYMMVRKEDSTVGQIINIYFGHLAELAQSVLLVGVLNPKWLSYMENSFPKGPRMSYAGLSWFLDAERGLLYSNSGSIDATTKYVDCKCRICSGIKPAVLMTDTDMRARHNLSYLIDHLANPSSRLALATYDLVLQENEKALLVSDLYIWSGRALLDDFLDFLRDEKPAFIVFIGDIFNLKSRPDLPETCAFFETLRELGSLVFVVKGCSDSDQDEFLSASDELMISARPKPMLWSKEEKPAITQAYLDLYRFYRCAKEELNIKLANGAVIIAKHGHDIVEDVSSSRKAMVEQMEEARAREHARWLIMGHLHKAFIDDERRVASTGCWAFDELYEDRRTFKEDLMTFVVVHGNGKVELGRRG